MKPLFALLAAATLSLPVLGHAETVFKWVDGNGVTNYTTTPPPANVRSKVAAISTAPAMTGAVPVGMSAGEEAQYWRDRRQREVADDLRESRARRDMSDLQQQQIRQQIASQYDEDQRRKAEEARRQSAFERCQFERRTNCDANGNSYDDYGTVVVARRRPQSITTAAPFPVPGSPLVTNPTPGAPSLSTTNPTPGAASFGSVPSTRTSRPALERR